MLSSLHTIPVVLMTYGRELICSITRAAENLWHKAFGNLNDEDKRTIDPLHTNKIDILKDVLEAVEKKKLLCLQKRWKYTRRNGEVIILRDLLEKVVVWVNKFKQVVDVAIQYDPLHAALPWVAIRFLLQVINPFITWSDSDTTNLDGYR